MKGFIEVTATNEQLESIDKHYAAVDSFEGRCKSTKTIGIIFKKEVGFYTEKAPKGCFIMDSCISNDKIMHEEGWCFNFREIYKQLKSKQSVQLDQKAYSVFLDLTQ